MTDTTASLTSPSPDRKPARTPFFRTEFGARLLVIAGMFLFWEIGARLYNDREFLAPASKTFVALIGLLGDPGVLMAIRDMILQLIAGFAMALVSGLVVGMIIGRHRPTYLTLFPIIMGAYAFPQITLLPILVLIFGIGPSIKIVFGFTHGFFPIVVNVIAGSLGVGAVYLRAAHSMGASKSKIYRHVVFPYLVPSLFTGMRLGMTATLLGVLLAELYASTRGVGYYTALFSESFRPENLFALILMVAVTAIVINEMLRRAERHFNRWRG